MEDLKILPHIRLAMTLSVKLTSSHTTSTSTMPTQRQNSQSNAQQTVDLCQCLLAVASLEQFSATQQMSYAQSQPTALNGTRQMRGHGKELMVRQPVSHVLVMAHVAQT